MLASALAWLNGSQIVALIVLLLMADRLQHRAWPFLLFGPLLLAAFIGLILVPTPLGIIVSAAVIGFTTAVTLTAVLALPPLLSVAGDVHRTAAGMFTVSYGLAIIIPTISGALWDATGRPWMAFVPLCVCAAALTVLGAAVTSVRPPADNAFVR